MKNESLASFIGFATTVVTSNGDLTFDKHTNFMNRQIGKLQSTGIALPHASRKNTSLIRKRSKRMRRFSASENHIGGIMLSRLQAS